MKKVLLFLILASMFNILQAQVFKEDYEYTRTTRVELSTDTIRQHTQKTLPFKDYIHISLSKNKAGESVFTFLSDEDNESAKRMVLEHFFNVKDFDIFDGKLYFCGSITNNNSTEAFIAYADIEDFFTISEGIVPNSTNIKFTSINNIYQDKIYSIDRIEVFLNEDRNEIEIAGIGKMYYGKPPYQRLVNNETFSITELVLVDPKEYYLDFFMFYTIKEEIKVQNQYNVNLGASPIYAPANSLELFYVLSDTIGGCYHTKFADITETDDKIYLTAINYSDTNVSDPINSRFIDIISFDKYSRQQQTSRIELPFETRQEYGVKTTHLYDDNIAVVFPKYNSSNLVECCTFKVEPYDTISFNVYDALIFDTIQDKPLIFDCEYLDVTNELLILKESIFQGERKDIVFHVSIDKEKTPPYTSYKYKIENTFSNDTLYFSDLQSSDMKNYTVSGSCVDDNLILYDMNYEALNQNISCFTSGVFQLFPLVGYSISSIPILKQGRFPKLSPSVINGNELFIFYSSSMFYDAFIMEHTINSAEEVSVIKECAE